MGAQAKEGDGAAAKGAAKDLKADQPRAGSAGALAEAIRWVKAALALVSPAAVRRRYLAYRYEELPEAPALVVRPFLDRLACTFPAPKAGPYNFFDMYELEAKPNSPELRKILGSITFVPYYKGAAPEFTLENLPEEREMRIRVRAFNGKGASAWVEWDGATCSRPIGWGGRGPGYTWDQTPTVVELWVEVPDGTRAKEIAVSVRPNKLRVDVRGEAVLAGYLGGVVRCTELGDYEWELDGPKTLKITLQKKMDGKPGTAEYKWRPEDQWNCVLDKQGHQKIDMKHAQWKRKEPYKPLLNARTEEELKMVLPDNKYYEKPIDQQRSTEDDELGSWGTTWKKK